MIVIKARGNLLSHELTNMPVLNPGDWFGKTWLIEIGGSYTPLFLIVEADSMSDAIDELDDYERYGNLIIVEDEFLGDYPEDERDYGPSGHTHLFIAAEVVAKIDFFALMSAQPHAEK